MEGDSSRRLPVIRPRNDANRDTVVGSPWHGGGPRHMTATPAASGGSATLTGGDAGYSVTGADPGDGHQPFAACPGLRLLPRRQGAAGIGRRAHLGRGREAASEKIGSVRAGLALESSVLLPAQQYPMLQRSQPIRDRCRPRSTARRPTRGSFNGAGPRRTGAGRHSTMERISTRWCLQQGRSVRDRVLGFPLVGLAFHQASIPRSRSAQDRRRAVEPPSPETATLELQRSRSPRNRCKVLTS